MSPDLRAAAFKAEALPYWRDVQRFARSLCHDEVEAEDVVQDTFLRAYASWHTYRPGTDCRKWLFAICRNVFLRARQRRREYQSVLEPSDYRGDGLSLATAPPFGTQQDPASMAELRRAVARALAAIPEPFRSAVLLVDIESCAYEDASQRLGVPIGTIRSCVHRARKLLREPLAPFAEDLGLRAVAGCR